MEILDKDSQISWLKVNKLSQNAHGTFMKTVMQIVRNVGRSKTFAKSRLCFKIESITAVKTESIGIIVVYFSSIVSVVMLSCFAKTIISI